MISRQNRKAGVLPANRSPHLAFTRLAEGLGVSAGQLEHPKRRTGQHQARRRWSGLLTAEYKTVNNGRNAVEVHGQCGVRPPPDITIRCLRRAPSDKGNLVVKRVIQCRGPLEAKGRWPGCRKRWSLRPHLGKNPRERCRIEASATRPPAGSARSESLFSLRFSALPCGSGHRSYSSLLPTSIVGPRLFSWWSVLKSLSELNLESYFRVRATHARGI